MTLAEWSDGAAGPVLNLFDELTEPDERWQDQALCAQVGGDAWFPDKGKSVLAVKAVCAACPVAGPCLEYVLEIESRPGTLGRHGIWAMTTPNDRARMERQRQQGRAA